jgi:hypothetical protein
MSRSVTHHSTHALLPLFNFQALHHTSSYTFSTAMIRSRRIPQVLNRICDEETILSAVLVTMDGELLGTSTHKHDALQPDPEAFGTLVTDICLEYIRLGESLNHNNHAGKNNANKSHKNQLQCFLMELDQGMVAAAQCGDFFILAVAAPDAPPGLVKAKLEAVSVHVQEALSTLSE